MSKKDEFKEYVRKNPHLINYVKNGEMTWQKFYEIFDLYGEEETAWSAYKKSEVKPSTSSSANNKMTDFFTWIKALDLDAISEGVNSLQRVVGVLGDLSSKNTTTKEEYVPRPLYKHFDD